MFAIGFGVVVWGLFLWRVFGYPIWITASIGLFNVILGVITPKSRKVDLRSEASDGVWVVVDKVMLRRSRIWFSSYELVLMDDALVLKKLASGKIVLLAIGVSLLMGGFFGGLTGVSVGEFLDQKKRDNIRDRNEFTTVARGDVKIPYETMSQVQLDGNSLKMVVGGRPFVLTLPLDYPPSLAEKAREVIPRRCWIRLD